MKNNYNPYTVPEHFFEETCLKATVRHRRHRRLTVMCSIAAAAVMFLTIAVPSVISRLSERNAVEQEADVNNLAQMYEYDIFLQVNFK